MPGSHNRARDCYGTESRQYWHGCRLILGNVYLSPLQELGRPAVLFSLGADVNQLHEGVVW
eukprot:4193142-Pyramimonas_sp.AAC.1